MNLSSYISKKISGKNSSNKFIKFAKSVAVISVMLGTMALVISLSILNGFDKALRENAVKFSSHITLRSFDRNPLPQYTEGIKKLKLSFPEITGVEPIIEGECLFRFEDNVEGLLMRGIKPELDINNFKNNIIEGKYKFSNSTAKEIIISKMISRKLKIFIGDEAVIFAVKITDNQNIPFPKVNKVKVVGIYETGMTQYDEAVIFMPFNLAAKMLDIPALHTTKYDINLIDIHQSRVLADSIDLVMGYPHFASSVFDIHNAIFSWIELQKEPIPLVLGLISIVAVLNIITTLLLLVIEKTNTIGILRALGMQSSQILRIFIHQGMRLGIIGTSIGLLIAFVFSILQKHFGLIKLNGELYFLDKLPVDISFNYYIIVALISIILSFFSTFFPAFIAVKVSPLKAIRLK